MGLTPANTSEAYALLRFNTEYVLKKLREEDSDH